MIKGGIEMKRFGFLTVLFTAVFAMMMTGVLSAQGMMSGDKPQTENSKKGAMWNNQYSMAQKIDSQSMALDKDFQKLQENFKNAMSMNNVSGVKEGLEQQQKMMQNMEPMMENQQDMSNKLMSIVDKRSNNNMASDNEKKLAENMMNQTQVMNEDYNSMRKDLKNMMNMDKMSDLKPAMQQHYNMMQNMSEMMTAQKDMAGQMMGMMNGNNMGSGMMQNNNMSKSGMQKSSMDPQKSSSDTTKSKSGKW
jgi:hypothetical protein